jgi:hypothetical protein
MADQVADTEAIRRFIAGFYAAFSFREGTQPNWDGLRGLFWHAGQAIEISGGEPKPTTPAEFIAKLRSRIAHGELLGQQEREIESAVRVQGDLAQVFSQFENRANAGAGGSRTVRGVNAFQLIRLQGRWQVLTVCRAEGVGPPPSPPRQIGPAPSPRPPFRPPHRPSGGRR